MAALSQKIVGAEVRPLMRRYDGYVGWWLKPGRDDETGQVLPIPESAQVVGAWVTKGKVWVAYMAPDGRTMEGPLSHLKIAYLPETEVKIKMPEGM